MQSLLHIFSLDNLRSLARDRSGATSIENSLLGALIAVAIIAAISELGSMVYQIFDLTAQSVEQAADGCGGGPGNGNGNCGNSGIGGGNTGGSGPGTGNGGGGNGGGS
jgi:Flp pilus assembly pilin Flp